MDWWRIFWEDEEGKIIWDQSFRRIEVGGTNVSNLDFYHYSGCLSETHLWWRQFGMVVVDWNDMIGCGDDNGNLLNSPYRINILYIIEEINLLLWIITKDMKKFWWQNIFW